MGSESFLGTFDIEVHVSHDACKLLMLSQPLLYGLSFPDITLPHHQLAVFLLHNLLLLSHLHRLTFACMLV